MSIGDLCVNGEPDSLVGRRCGRIVYGQVLPGSRISGLDNVEGTNCPGAARPTSNWFYIMSIHKALKASFFLFTSHLSVSCSCIPTPSVGVIPH